MTTSPELLHRADLRTLWLLGQPVGHSLSPLIQNSALSHLGLPIVYLAAPVTKAALPSAVRGLLALGALGANVTVPHKEAAFELCEAVSPRASAMGACNVLRFLDGRIHGDNTDGAGWLRGIEDALGATLPPRALVLGAGGAARAVAYSLLERAVPEIVVFNRRRERAEQMVSDLQTGSSRLQVASLAEFASHLDADCLVVQTTSVGLQPNEAPLVPVDRWPPGVLLSELIYGRQTALAARVQSLGGRLQDGLPMLVYQAAESLALWLERPLAEIPSQLMMDAARRHLAGR